MRICFPSNYSNHQRNEFNYIYLYSVECDWGIMEEDLLQLSKLKEFPSTFSFSSSSSCSFWNNLEYKKVPTSQENKLIIMFLVIRYYFKTKLVYPYHDFITNAHLLAFT
jgi:hypothetical protein